ncbi:DeoR/GlpR family DNA-binding transcription regulator [Paenibacillus glycinis]|uniref:DeoR family transcriptional regulator n=1 Tax=Paenibacillus glycinis TaxID=2697035 RepID=A0ABW9XUL7_9BACL|nr:DeoR/GlpR family DNA-binding transcription regulator [Paenibacillus glycinis]NBD26363.1 DeoR family transcriptional regulator [Paenibacillus glycinis]
MLAEERRQHILDLLAREGRIIAKDLAGKFQLSIDSIRRDLTIMEEQGLLQKTYGGAIPLSLPPKVRTFAQPRSIRYGEGAPHQNAISEYAASLIQKNDTVFIGSAGIHYGMLKYLPADIPFTVITNSLTIAEWIRNQPQIESYLIGGKLRSIGDSMIDTIALETIGKYNFDIGFITGGGVALNGVSTSTPEGAAFTRAVAEASRRTICLAPHEKVGVRMFAATIPLHQIDLLITDQGVSEKAIREFESKNVDVVVADEDFSSEGVNHEGD